MTSLIEALETGDNRTLLVAMRDKIAQTIDEGVSPRDLSSLCRRLIDVANAVRALDAAADADEGLPIGKLRAVLDEKFDPTAI